jgi:glutathione S-transferase
MQPLPTLYSFRRCPYAMRARMALHVAETAYELCEVSLRNKPQALLDASPKATVPVLVLADGHVLEQSLDIMRWALSQHDPEHWLRFDHAAAHALLEHNDGPFKFSLDRYKYAHRYAYAYAKSDQEAAKHRTLGLQFLEILETHVTKHAHLFGEEPSLADVAIFPFVRQFTSHDPAWFETTDLPHVKRWLQWHVGHKRFAAIMASPERKP